ncbi:COX15/CtaA family protein [Zhouia spongiae]|uniref:Heme A synthase n=1 Tax=Zhouia spongiae TaxID=2202721 RepID=A0ABY3YJ85_9FLAO|nr:COX15/CtaA family protein [Zhouia spongiae]UNY97566.1 COX15/CtaA family protein [Zhouia spongiae]
MQKDSKKVVYWLLIGCFLIFIMVIVGGITRLTHSGLSMSEYKLVTDMLPPMNEQQWHDAFEVYKQFPEYQKLNNHFTLEDFKDIYFWEWLHRLIGRVIGIVFFIPFIYFLLTKQLTRKTTYKSMILMLLGGFQGFLGWYMVKSGLIDRPDVSHYRLAIHLIAAFITFAATFWVALDIIYPTRKTVSKPFRNLVILGMAILILQIVWGAFVAGLDAGWVHNHWPLMSEGKLIHETVYIEQETLWKNLTEGRSGVQFVHRYLAYIVVLIVGIIAYKAYKMNLTTPQKNGINALVTLVILQFILGVFTLILAVPVWLGVVHQVGAFFLLSAMTFTLHRFR